MNKQTNKDMAAKIFRINYKSDFILTLESDAGWATPFCIKFWTGAPSQAYFAGYDGTTYTHCAYDPSEPSKLTVQFDDHHLPIGDLKYQVAYHFTVADFPNDTEDEVMNQASITTEIDGETYQVMLDFNGETAPEIQFALPAYAAEAQRIANEEQRIANEQQRIRNEETRIDNEQTRINQESARVNEYAELKADAVAATGAANDAAALATQKAGLAGDAATLATQKAGLADDAATLATQKAGLADDAATLATQKAGLADDAATLATQKAGLADDAATLATQKAQYAQDEGDYAKAQGDYAKSQADLIPADVMRTASDAAFVNANREALFYMRQADEHLAGLMTSAEHNKLAALPTAADLGTGIIYDVSALHPTSGVSGGRTYASLSAALAVIPQAKRKGGMSVKFVQSSDNKYVQYRLMLSEFTTAQFTNVANWQGVDDEPTVESENLVKSSGVYDALFNRVEGNNKLDWSARLVNKYIDYHGVIVDNSNGFCVSNAITVKKGDIIYFAQYSTALDWRLTLSIEVCEFDGNNTFIKKTTVLYTSRDGEFLPCEITGDNTAYIRINFQPNASATDGVVFINEKLPYEPYIEPIDVPKYESKEDAEEIKEHVEAIFEEISHAVYTTPQTLTNAQKAQARTNIESASDAEVEFLSQQVNALAGEIQNGRINTLMVDLLQSIKVNSSTLNTIGPFNIVSSTENSITLSAEDYGNMPSGIYLGLCIEIQTGTTYPEYKNAIFRLSENNTLVQIGTSVDLSNAMRCSSIHDTLSGGNGIHLSPFGYRSLACTISEMLTMKDCYNYKNYIGGFVSMACKQGEYNTVNIEATDGTVLVEPIRVNTQVAGYFPPESGYSNIGPKWGYIENINENLHGYSGLTKQFTFQQYKDENTQEVSIELPFNFNRKRGYLVIEGNTDNVSFPGTAKLDVIENGVVIWSVTMSSIAQKYVIGIRDWSAFSVKVSLLENKVTKAMLSAVCLYEMYDGFEYPNLSGKNIAVLGDSWCVFNDMTTSKHFLGENNEDCENFGQYPDGTPTEYSAYCALFPKYLAHITGGNVDNWGRGGTTSANWGLVKIDQILAFKDYDYMVIEFFVNDKNSGMSVDTWRRNLQEICRKCIKRGVQPIVIMPCVTQGTGFSYAQWNNYLLQGLYFGLD